MFLVSCLRSLLLTIRVIREIRGSLSLVLVFSPCFPVSPVVKNPFLVSCLGLKFQGSKTSAYRLRRVFDELSRAVQGSKLIRGIRVICVIRGPYLLVYDLQFTVCGSNAFVQFVPFAIFVFPSFCPFLLTKTSLTHSPHSFIIIGVRKLSRHTCIRTRRDQVSYVSIQNRKSKIQNRNIRVNPSASVVSSVLSSFVGFV